MTNTDQDFTAVLREVVRRGAADDAARVRGLLADLMPGMPAPARVAVAAVQEGVPADLRRAGAGGSIALAIARGVDRLVDQHGYDRALASRMVRAWAAAIGDMRVRSAPDGARNGEREAPTGGRAAEASAVGNIIEDGRPYLVVDPSPGGVFRTIGEAIKAAPDDGVVVVRAGTYREALVIDKSVEVRGEGRRGGVVVESSGAHAIQFKGPRSVLRNIVIKALGETGTWGAVIVMSGCPVIEDCDLSSSVGAGIYVTGADSNPHVLNSTIADGKMTGIDVSENGKGIFERCTVTGNAKEGVVVQSGGDPVLRECMIADGKDDGICVLTGGKGTFDRCTVTRNALVGIRVKTEGDPAVRNCEITDNRGSGIHVYENGKGTFERSDIRRNGLSGIRVTTGGSPRLRDCTLVDGLGNGAWIDDNGKGTLDRCRVSGNAKAGIAVATTGDPIVRDCTISDGLRSGIAVSNSGKGAYVRCQVTGNATAGIEIRSGGDPDVQDCTVQANRHLGIAVWSDGQGTISGCTLIGNVPQQWWVEVGAGGTRHRNQPEAPK